MQTHWTRRLIPIALIICLSLLSGCETTGPKTVIGGLGGATAGGLFAAMATGDPKGIAAGTIVGGLLGGAIGSGLDTADQRYASRATQAALEHAPTGAPTPWRNPTSGHRGAVTPLRTYQTYSGRYCREYQQSVVIDGRRQSSYGTACRQPDGSWRVTN